MNAGNGEINRLESQSTQCSSTPVEQQNVVSPLPTPSTCSDQPSVPSTSAARKVRARTSNVWNSFERLTIDGLEKAKCLQCGHLLSATTKNGTSHLRDHINTRCSKKLAKVDIRQQFVKYNLKNDGTATMESHNFNQEVTRKELANMIVLHEYPMNMVNHLGFKRYSASLNPSFKMISGPTLRSDIMKTYACEMSKLKSFFEKNSGRIAITTDMWTSSNQKKGYMAVTAHYIDEKWKLHDKIVRFCYVRYPHTSEMLAEVLLRSLSMFNIHEKISSVVMDNCSTNDKIIEILHHRFDSSSLLLGGAFLHVRCSAHILNLIVQDGLAIISSGILKVRDCVSFWTASSKRKQMFEDKARILKVDCSRMLIADCKTRRNSTFAMLQSALPYKDVFHKLKIQHPRFSFDIPTSDEWKWAAMICDKLAKFNKATEIFSGRRFPTSNLFFSKVFQIKIALNDWCLTNDPKIKEMTEKMLKKFDKYWSSVSGLFAAAAILDPRDKMESVEWYYGKIYGDDACIEIDRVKSLMFDLLIEYREPEVDNEICKSASLGKGQDDDVDDDDFSLVKKQRKKKTNVRSELEYYLEDSALPDCKEFDILNFWKSDLKYPTLRKIARDILAIPASTVASESAFSAGGRVVTAHRNKLGPDTVEALMCLGNWIRGDITGDALVDLLADEDEEEEQEEESSNGMEFDYVVDNYF